jgi:hypothetical protein
MCFARILFASSMNGRFSDSVNVFHSDPSRFEISELCIFGFSCAIWRRFMRDQTMKAFIGRLMWLLSIFFLSPLLINNKFEVVVYHRHRNIWNYRLTIGLYHAQDDSTNTKFNIMHFLSSFFKEKKALAFS